MNTEIYSKDYNWLYDFIVENKGIEITGIINPMNECAEIDKTKEVEIKIYSYKNKLIVFGNFSFNILSSKFFFTNSLCEKYNLKFIKL